MSDVYSGGRRAGGGFPAESQDVVSRSTGAFFPGALSHLSSLAGPKASLDGQ